jgi:hypothetical protein
MRGVFLCFLVVCQAVAIGAVYQSTSAGVVTFSDRPSLHSRELTVDKVSISRGGYSPTLTKKEVALEKPAKASASRYQSLTFVAPAQASIWNQRPIIVKVALTPRLQKEDQLQLLLDGMRIQGPQTSTEFIMQDVDRGKHKIDVQVLDADKRIVKSVGRVIYVHYSVKRLVIPAHIIPSS